MAPRVRVYLACSLDGFIAGPDDDLDWLSAPSEDPDLPPDEAALGFEAFLEQVGVMVMGRRTYDVVRRFGAWPYGELPVLVTTHRPLAEAPGTVEAIAGDIAEVLNTARARAGGRDVYLDGGDLVRQALAADLVDEMVLTMVPTVLGGGVRLFEGIDRTRFRFVRYAAYGRFVQLTMARSADA